MTAIQKMSPDSEIASQYASASTKTTCIVNGALSPYFKDVLVKTLRQQPFSVAVDGSNDCGLEKLNPLTVRYDKRKSCYTTTGHVSH